MKIANITPIGKQKVYDLSVEEVEHYVLENGVVTHNTGIMYSSDNVYIIGRQQEKPKDELLGYNFIINVEKSRFVREKSKIPIEVSFEGGISKWSGLLDMALESGHVIKPSNGWYQRVDMTTGEAIEGKLRKKDTYTKEFWLPVLRDPTFTAWISNRYTISNVEGIMEDELSEEGLEQAYEQATSD